MIYRALCSLGFPRWKDYSVGDGCSYRECCCGCQRTQRHAWRLGYWYDVERPAPFRWHEGMGTM